MLPPSIMVKFFTQSCPRCLAKPSSLNDAKCLCIVKGHIVAARGYVEGGEKNKTMKKEGEAGPSTANREKTNEELFVENATKALEMLKKGQKAQKESKKQQD